MTLYDTITEGRNQRTVRVRYSDGTCKQIEFTEITAIFDREEIPALLIHDLDDEYHNGDCITGEFAHLPDDSEDAKNILECYLISDFGLNDAGKIVSNE